jgi:hypothetical protein
LVSAPIEDALDEAIEKASGIVAAIRGLKGCENPVEQTGVALLLDAHVDRLRRIRETLSGLRALSEGRRFWTPPTPTSALLPGGH